MSLIDDILLPGSLWAIMFSMGLSLTVGDFRRLLTNRRALLLGIVSMLVVPPLIGVALALAFAPSPALAVGFVLLATCPGGMLSNLMTDLSRGDLALSLSMSVAVSAIYVLVVPVYAYLAINHFLGIEQQVDLPLGTFFWRIFSITLVPVSLGLALRHWQQALAERLRGYIKVIAMAVLCFAFVVILLDQVEVLKENFGRLFWMTLAMNAGVLGTAFILSRGFSLTPRETSAVCIEHLIRQEATAIYIAVAIVGNREMSLPMIMNTPVGLLICIAFVIAMRQWVRRRSEASTVEQPS